MNKYVVGDIHGRSMALKEVLEKCRFDLLNDRLIFLGDICDNFKPVNVRACFEILRTVNNLIWIEGNHDVWLRKWFRCEFRTPEIYTWLYQGGFETRDEYLTASITDIEKVKPDWEMLEEMIPYFIDEDNNLFVHGGINWNESIDKQSDRDIYYWDRYTYFEVADSHVENCTMFPYKRVFIGHTTVYPSSVPVHKQNLINLDTGAGNGGPLTIMNVDTLEYWQSNKVENKFGT